MIESYNVVRENDHYKIYVNGQFYGNAKDIPEVVQKLKKAEKELASK
jgi:hypothetical protein